MRNPKPTEKNHISAWLLPMFNYRKNTLDQKAIAMTFAGNAVALPQQDTTRIEEITMPGR